MAHTDTDNLTCLDQSALCDGPVEMCTTPDRQDGKHFPRCRAHHETRLEQAEKNLEFDRWARNVDPADCGEVYDDGDDW